MQHFIELSLLDKKDQLPGTSASYFQTEFSTIAYTEMRAGASVPLHQHYNEAVDIVIEGVLEMHIGETRSILQPGMMSFVPSNEMHKARALTDCKVITVIHPKREL